MRALNNKSRRKWLIMLLALVGGALALAQGRLAAASAPQPGAPRSEPTIAEKSQDAPQKSLWLQQIRTAIKRGAQDWRFGLSDQLTPLQDPAEPLPAPTTPTPAPCRDQYEDDGIVATAKALAPDETQTHLFCPAGDADWLRFYAQSGPRYQFVTTALSAEANAYIYLFAPDGATVLASNDNSPALNGIVSLYFAAPANGWYFAQVKNHGDLGAPAMGYRISLSLAGAASATSTATATAEATNTATPGATTQPLPTSAIAPANTIQPGSATAPEAPAAAVTTATAINTAISAADDLLRPQEGGAGSGGLPVFDAGPAGAMTPDQLEPNDTFTQAVAINVGAVYQQLNFVPDAAGAADGDFYFFRAKPGLCYRIQTGDLAPGLDTTILLWQAGATRENRKLVAQNDDAHPKTADLSSSVRWCSGVDSFMVIELHNYGWAPQTDPRGKSYSLAVLIDAPTPTATTTPRPAAGSGATSGASSVNSGVSGSAANSVGAPAPAATSTSTATATWTATPTATASPTAVATFTPEPTALPDPAAVVSSATAPASATLSATASPTATPTPIPTAVADLTCYLDLNQNGAPDPSEGITGLRGVVIDTLSNAIIAASYSDGNGHIRLQWTGRASVRIALPDLGWNQEVTAGQLQRDKDAPLGAGHWSAEAQVKAPALPGILP